MRNQCLSVAGCVRVFLGVAMLFCLGIAGANGFDEFLVLAIKDPKGYGFTDPACAKSAKLGIAYPYFNKAEWEKMTAGLDGEEGEVAKLLSRPQALMQEVLCSEEVARCVFIQRLDEVSGAYTGMLMGLPNLADEMAFLRSLESPKQVVLVADPETRRLFWVDARVSFVCRNFPAPKPENN